MCGCRVCGDCVCAGVGVGGVWGEGCEVCMRVVYVGCVGVGECGVCGGVRRVGVGCVWVVCAGVVWGCGVCGCVEQGGPKGPQPRGCCGRR